MPLKQSTYNEISLSNGRYFFIYKALEFNLSRDKKKRKDYKARRISEIKFRALTLWINTAEILCFFSIFSYNSYEGNTSGDPNQLAWLVRIGTCKYNNA